MHPPYLPTLPEPSLLSFFHVFLLLFVSCSFLHNMSHWPIASLACTLTEHDMSDPVGAAPLSKSPIHHVHVHVHVHMRVDRPPTLPNLGRIPIPLILTR